MGILIKVSQNKVEKVSIISNEVCILLDNYV